MIPTDLEAVRKRHEQECLIPKAKSTALEIAHKDRGLLLAHIGAPPDQATAYELELLICNSEFHRGSHEDADALARVILQRFPGLGSGK